MPDDEDWLYRPVMRNLCKYTDLLDGTLDLVDIAILNDLLDVHDENMARSQPKDD